jgi:hypothetical protein
MLLGYYDKYTKKDAHGKLILFGVKVNTNDGHIVKYSGQAQQVQNETLKSFEVWKWHTKPNEYLYNTSMFIFGFMDKAYDFHKY